MRYSLLAAALLTGLAGCWSGPNYRGGEAYSAGGPREDIEVRVPRQKVVVDMPPPSSCQAQAPPSQCQQQPAPCQQPPAPCQAPPPPQYSQPTMTTQVRERTGFGLMFDTIRIPMPILRPVAIPRPAEMTTTMP